MGVVAVDDQPPNGYLACWNATQATLCGVLAYSLPCATIRWALARATGAAL